MPASSVPTPAWMAGCSSATSTSTARRGKRPTHAAAARMPDNAGPDRNTPTTSLSLSGRVDLLLGYVDLHRRAYLPYLGQRLDSREMAPVGPVYSLLVEFALHDC